MKRPGLRPTLEGMVSNGSTPSSSVAVSHDAPSWAQGAAAVPSATGAPLPRAPATGPGGRVLPRLSESFAAVTSSALGLPSLERRGVAVSVLQSFGSVNQSAHSFLVSASGGMLTLGDHYHVSSSGVAEFKDNRTEDLGLSRTGGLSCQHISELDFDNGLQIGRGSSGKIYNVVHIPTGIHVCVKQMTIDDAHHREEIKRELDSLHAAPSRWIVDFHGAFFHHDLGVILLVLELMDGSLRDLLNVTKRLTELQVKAVCLQAVHSLAFLHEERSLIHRDIKPENLLFHRSGRIKVTDFGVSRGNRSHDPASVHTFVGSISYMSPERLEGKAYGYEVDVWSLGIVLCEALTGFHPFQEDFTITSQKLTFWDLLQKVVAGGTTQGGPSPLEACLLRMRAAGCPPVEASPEMVSFVGECLAFDRANRASARALIHHPWLEDISLDASEGIIAEMAIQAARLKDAETRQLAAATDGTSSPAHRSPHTPGDAALPQVQQAKTPIMSTPEESRQRSENLIADLMASSRPRPKPATH